jgi:hypothetical protein
VTEGVGPCVRPLVDFPFGWCVARNLLTLQAGWIAAGH